MLFSRRAFIGGCGALTSVALAGCDGALFPHVRRFLFKLTLSVDGQEHTGSSVCELHYGRTYTQGFDAAGYYSMHTWGESPFVVIDGKQAVFALLNELPFKRAFQLSNVSGALAQYAPEEVRKAGGKSLFEYVMNDLDGEYELTGDHLPELVYFENPQGYWSVRELPLLGTSVGGKDVHLLSATLTRTEDQLTHKLNADILPAFDGHRIRPPFRPTTFLPIDQRPLEETIPGDAFLQEGQGCSRYGLC